MSTYYLSLVILHLATVGPAFLIGSALMLMRKGSPLHRGLGKLYLLLMFATAMVALLLPSHGAHRWLGHFGPNHLFVIPVVYCVPAAYLAARRGDIAAHRGNMIGLYVGAVLLAGAFAFAPGRLLHHWLFE